MDVEAWQTAKQIGGVLAGNAGMTWVGLVIPYFIFMTVTRPLRWKETGGPNRSMMFTRMGARLLMLVLFFAAIAGLVMIGLADNAITSAANGA